MSATCSISGPGIERDPPRRLADSLLGLSPDSAPDTRLAAVLAFIAAAPVDARLQPFLHEMAEAPLAGWRLTKNRKPAGGELKMKTMSLVIVVLSLGIFGANAAEPNKIVPICWEENINGQVERHCEVRRDNGEIISTPTPDQRAQPYAPPSPTPPPPQQAQTSPQQTPPTPRQGQRLQIYGPGFYVYVGPDK